LIGGIAKNFFFFSEFMGAVVVVNLESTAVMLTVVSRKSSLSCSVLTDWLYFLVISECNVDRDCHKACTQKRIPYQNNVFKSLPLVEYKNLLRLNPIKTN
ncbi:hypothetical protein, partial [Pectobacterium carotovorum]|uniref:hypothetical protein n=1 Tax=Pectobacterium carotovorum TaxID=554 RepID=UPI001CF50F51